jgi:hypothetical protein
MKMIFGNKNKHNTVIRDVYGFSSLEGFKNADVRRDAKKLAICKNR